MTTPNAGATEVDHEFVAGEKELKPKAGDKAKAGDKKPAMPIGQALVRMISAAKKFDLEKVNLGDLAYVAAGAEGGE